MILHYMEYDVIAIGSATRDVLLGAKEFKVVPSGEFSTGQGLCFGLGSKIDVDKIEVTIGGGGANASVTFARQGLKTACISAIGEDLNGQEVLQKLQTEGVDTQYFQKHNDDLTAYSNILVSDKAERTILSYKGEGQHFDVAKIPFDQLQAKWLYLDSLGGHYDLLEKAVKWAAENNIKLAANPGGKELAHGLEKLRPLLKYFSIVLMNQEEAAALTGIDYNDEEKIFKFMDEVVGGIFAMTKGPNGSVVSDGQHIYSAGIPDSPVVERTGAGDAFSAGFISEYIRSGNVIKAIQLATANASSVVTQYGAIAGILKQGNMGSWPLVEVSQK
ncbi:MAG TPA: carbohydrate kinase family protein [Candidatus Paceibacterota bacterium]|nr:carbohydrate kinase family protein [Candidatus Paceibacterota bacterium]